MKLAHYVNQFFAGLGGAENAGQHPVRIEGAVGPGRALGVPVSYTLACGDDYFGEHEDRALEQLLAHLEDDPPDILICGPAFGSGRYGYACGTLGREATRLGIPSVTSMDPDNPGVLAGGGAVYIVPSGTSVVEMKQVLPRLVALAAKLASGASLASAEAEGFLAVARRRNRVVKHNSAKRAVDMILDKVTGRSFVTEIEFDSRLVTPAAAIPDLSTAVVALVTEGGCVPQGNPDRLPSTRASTWHRYAVAGLDSLDASEWETVHGGFDTSTANRDPNRIAPLDALRRLEEEGRIGRLHPELLVTTGNNTSVAMASRMGAEMAEDLAEAGVDAIVLTGT